MKFHRITWFHVTDFGWPDVSFGIHICMAGRIDVHFLKWMFSFGVVPLYRQGDSVFAASNSFHTDRTNRAAFRSGSPMP